MNDPLQRTTGRRSAALALLVALVPAIPIVAGFLITSEGVGAKSARTAGYIPVAPDTPAAKPAPASERGALVALVSHGATMRASPGGRPLAKVPLRTEFGSPEALWVVSRSPGWLGVISTLAGNGRIGWIPDAAAALARVPWRLEVSLSARRLTVLKDGHVVQRYTVAIGRPVAPTPTGRFAVTDRLATNDPTGPYGCCILALSARSPHAIQGWNGGYRIAIHSTPDTSSIGQPVSHGCMRLTVTEGRWLMNHIPLGTPTLIRD